MMAVLKSYANIVSDPLLWDGFCNDINAKIDDKFYSVLNPNKNTSCNPFGNMSWIDINTHSDVIGTNWIPSMSKAREENPLLINDFPTSPNENFGLAYNNDIKKLFSIYRPKYINFYNMNKIVTNNILYNKFGFTGGLINCNNVSINLVANNNNITETIFGYALNYCAFNMDYKPAIDYTFENIINANIPNGGCL